MKVKKLIVSAAVAAMLRLIGATTAHAAITQITGGDATEGMTLVPANVVVAYDFAVGGTVQGVTFGIDPSAVGFTPPTAVAYPTEFASGYFGATANDHALVNGPLDETVYSGTSGAQISITGLTPLTTYNVDFLVGFNNADIGFVPPSSETVDFITPETGTISHGTAWDFTGQIAADLSGNATLSYGTASPSAGHFPTMDALVLSSIPAVVPTAPEPTSLAMLGLGAAAILARRRRKI